MENLYIRSPTVGEYGRLHCGEGGLSDLCRTSLAMISDFLFALSRETRHVENILLESEHLWR